MKKGTYYSVVFFLPKKKINNYLLFLTYSELN